MSWTISTSRRLAGAAVLLLLLSGCPATAPGGPDPGAAGDSGPAGAAGGQVSEAAAAATIAAPAVGGRGSVAAGLPAGQRPTKSPAQAGAGLAGRALPTNQWWSSALTGPFTQPIWAHPLAVRADAAGLQVSSAPIAASANAVVTPFAPALAAGGPATGVTVTGYGAFHVSLRVALAGGGSVDATVVSGSPVLWLRFTGASARLTGLGPVRDLGATGPLTRLDVAGQRWDVLAGSGGWRVEGATLAPTAPHERQVAIARVPAGVDEPTWEQALAGAAADPVVQTTASMAYDRAGGVVTQTLTARRASGGPGVWALLPHQRAAAAPAGGASALAGTYPDARGELSLARAAAIRIPAPMPGLLPGVPAAPVPAAARDAVVTDLEKDLADPPGAGGSYFGLKELARLATIAEVAGAVKAPTQRRKALDKLRPQLVDWLTYSGPTDARHFAYDKTWGGLIATPAEFGAQDYNDHHFQYGYLVRAAAVLAAADPGFARDYGAVVDLVIRDFAGALADPGLDPRTGGFPPFRAFNAYLGSSAAAGYAAFADGNNQESSSEAVAAWEAVVRWGLVRGDKALTEYGVAHYALEAATARAYWLGEGLPRPAGYAHTTAGIVWDAKIDYATWFDPKPESVLGIQLLPLTFGSLYRGSPDAARTRAAQLRSAVGGDPRVWGDLFAADLALADPAAARRRLASAPREESTSRALVRYWVEALAVLGPPQPAVTADVPYALAFGDPRRPRAVAVPPPGATAKVTFRRADRVVATLP